MGLQTMSESESTNFHSSHTSRGHLEGMELRASREVAALLQEFIDACSAIWLAYQRSGPGRLEVAGLADPQPLCARLLATLGTGRLRAFVESAPSLRSLIQNHRQIEAAVDECLELTLQCRDAAHGLCFVTGEAGLVPRRDLEAKLQHHLQHLAQIAGVFRRGGAPG